MKIILLVLFLFISSPAWASTWFVRDGGGVKGTSSTTCNGQKNAVFTGSNGPNCAFNHPRWLTGWDVDSPQAGVLAANDTAFIDGDSDVNPGQQAKYLIGYDDSGANTTPSCKTAFPYDCILANIPSGVSIIGTGTHKPQLWGNERAYQVLTATSTNITLQSLEITDHAACEYNSPNAQACNYNTSYPYGAWALDGVLIGGTGLTMTDVYIHGLGRYGINVPDATTSMGSATFTRLYSIGNGYGGVTTGVNNTFTGTLTFNQPIIEWNGCREAYPPAAGIDNPSNYTDCFGQNSGGYGDALAFGNSIPGGGQLPGNWTVIGPGSISFNTQDGLDLRHGSAGNGIVHIDKMRFEGNAGQAIKVQGITDAITNNVIIGDCGWWFGAAQSYSGFVNGDICRPASSSTVFVSVRSGTSFTFNNNTMLSNANVMFESNDDANAGCDGSQSLIIKNNIFLGGYNWQDDSTWNGTGGNSQVTFFFNDGNDSAGGGTCGSLVPTEDYNIIKDFKNSNNGCNGAHDQCGTNPIFSGGTFPMGTSGGGANTYYQGTSGITLIPLGGSSPAITAGVNGLSYWNNSNDYYNVTRTSPPSLGGLELNSCATTSFGCFFNSDCCSNSCVSNVCAISGGGGGSGDSISGNYKISGSFKILMT